MMENIGLTRGVIFSQQVLLKLIEKRMSREEAYAVVQDNAMRAWQDGLEFKDLLLADERVRAVIGRKEIEEVFRLENFLENVDYIFERTFGGKRGHKERKNIG